MDVFSAQVAAQIFAAFPEWRSKAGEEKAPDGTSYLVLRIAPPPESKADHPLHIDTSNHEVTVGFDSCHSHYDSWISDSGTSFGADAAIDFVKKLLAEEVVVISCWSGDKWRGSAQSEPTGNFKEHLFVHSSDTIRVKSWRGTYSREFVVA